MTARAHGRPVPRAAQAELTELARGARGVPQGYSNSIPPMLAATSDLAVVRLHGHSDQ